MAETSNIEWCDATFNPWIGCTKVSPGCDHCYAERATPSRTLGVVWGPHAERRRTSVSNWKLPLRWNAKPFFACEGCGWRGEDDTESSRLRICLHCGTRLIAARRRVFCASLADVFDNAVPPSWREDLFALIKATPHLDWLLLTKRIGNVPLMVSLIPGWMPRNVWLGISVVNQAEADRDIPKLLALGAAVHWLSIEPMLGPINLRRLNRDSESEINVLQPLRWEQEIDDWRGTSDAWEEDFEDWFNLELASATGPMHAGIDWVVAGGESGPEARPAHPDWFRSLRDQCASACVPFLFKQWGEWVPDMQQGLQSALLGGLGPDPVSFHRFDDATRATKVGKKAAGRLLDGVQHDGYPEGAA